MMDAVLAWLVGYLPLAKTIIMIIGSLVVAAQAYVLATPSQDDDAWFAKIEAIPVLGDLLIALQKFAVFQRK